MTDHEVTVESVCLGTGTAGLTVACSCGWDAGDGHVTPPWMTYTQVYDLAVAHIEAVS